MPSVKNNQQKPNRALVLISGGIDSPVAAYRMIQEGWNVDFLFFFTKPFVRDIERDIVLSCIRRLKEISKSKRMFKLFIISSSKAHSEILSKTPANLRYLLLRRMMWKVADVIAKKHKYSALVTGESLGQVASQTLQNMTVLSSEVSVPILRPLLGFDKEETISIAKKIGTFEYSKCHRDCGLGPVAHPRTNASESEILAAEKDLKLKSLAIKITKSIEEIDF